MEGFLFGAGNGPHPAALNCRSNQSTGPAFRIIVEIALSLNPFTQLGFTA